VRGLGESPQRLALLLESVVQSRVTMKPSRARRTAGATISGSREDGRSDDGSSYRPAGEPGTAAGDRADPGPSRAALPSLLAGTCRAGRPTERSRENRASRFRRPPDDAKPPPPKIPACGWTTASASATATAASTALPPWRRASGRPRTPCGSADAIAPPEPIAYPFSALYVRRRRGRGGVDDDETHREGDGDDHAPARSADEFRRGHRRASCPR